MLEGVMWNCLRNWFRCFDISADLITGIANETNSLCEFIPLRNTVLRGFLIPIHHVNEKNKPGNATDISL